MIVHANNKEYEVVTCWRKHYDNLGTVELYKTIQIEKIKDEAFIAISVECAYGKKSDTIAFSNVLKSKYSISTYIDKACKTLKRQILLGIKGELKW